MTRTPIWFSSEVRKREFVSSRKGVSSSEPTAMISAFMGVAERRKLLYLMRRMLARGARVISAAISGPISCELQTDGPRLEIARNPLAVRRGISKLADMVVHLKPETESRLRELAASTGRAPEDLVEDAMVGYLAELAELRDTLDSRYDEINASRVQPIDGEDRRR